MEVSLPRTTNNIFCELSRTSRKSSRSRNLWFAIIFTNKINRENGNHGRAINMSTTKNGSSVCLSAGLVDRIVSSGCQRNARIVIMQVDGWWRCHSALTLLLLYGLPIAMQIICAMGDNERLKSIDPWEQISKSMQIRVSTYTRVIQISLANGRRAFIANTSWFAFKYVPLNREILNEPRGALTSKRFSSGLARLPARWKRNNNKATTHCLIYDMPTWLIYLFIFSRFIKRVTSCGGRAPRADHRYTWETL